MNPYPYFNFFGINIPYYGMLFVAGLFLSSCIILLNCKKRNIKQFDAVCCACFTGIGAILGAKTLSILTSIDIIIQYNLSIVDIIKNGFVFYGGLIGGFFGLLIYCKKYKLQVVAFLDVFAVSVPLGHSLGRVGCFLSGCCFGVNYNGPLSVIYTTTANPSTPLNTPLLPIQLIEALFLIVLFIVLEILFYTTNKKGLCVTTYILSYAIVRFVLEFFRNDAERRFLFSISTSQIISILLIFLTLSFIFYKKIKR